MKPNRRPISPKVLAAGLSCFMISLIAGGCTGSKVAKSRTQDPERVSLEDFVDYNAVDQSDPTRLTFANGNKEFISNAPQTEAPDRPVNDGITLVATNQDSVRESIAIPASVVHIKPDELSLFDAKVGDVNGKPIFTNSFFEPLEDRLIAEATTQPSIQAWRNASGAIISSRLNGMITDELLRAEALAALSPTQRVGLQAFLSNFRNNLISENLGSSQLASRRILEEQGQTLDEALKQKEIDTLVQLTLFQEINRQVNVSWRDIQLRYERDIEKFSPPPTAQLRVIRAFQSDTEKIETIQSELDSGTRFIVIAAGKLNNYKSETDGLLEMLIDESYETTKFFGPDILNERTQKLAIGEMVGPIESGTTVYWIKLMDIVQESVSLYDAQLQIQRELTYERRTAVKEEYLNRLMERAKISSRDEVLMRLLEIAEERYGPNS